MTTLLNKVLTGSLVGSLLLSGALGLALAWSTSQLSSAKEVIRGLSSWQDLMIGSVGLAAGSPKKLSPDAAIIQVSALGQAHAALKQSAAKSNEAVRRLEQLTADAREAQVKEAAGRAQAVAQAQNLQTKLEAQALTTVPVAEVEPRIRKLQDELYEAGL